LRTGTHLRVRAALRQIFVTDAKGHFERRPVRVEARSFQLAAATKRCR
jgi:hypothetical protein